MQHIGSNRFLPDCDWLLVELHPVPLIVGDEALGAVDPDRHPAHATIVCHLAHFAACNHCYFRGSAKRADDHKLATLPYTPLRCA